MQHAALTVKTNSVFAFELFSFFKASMWCNLVVNLRMLTESFCLTLYALMSLMHPPYEQVDRLTAIIASEKNLIRNFVVVSGNAGITVDVIHWHGMRSWLKPSMTSFKWSLSLSAVSGPLRFEPSLCSSPWTQFHEGQFWACFVSTYSAEKWRSSFTWDMTDTHGLNWPAMNLSLRNSESA